MYTYYDNADPFYYNMGIYYLMNYNTPNMNLPHPNSKARPYQLPFHHTNCK